MEIYLVGGAVRDQLLGLPVKEKDWVVVGATPTEMLEKGFRQVGKDFPVFLHPDTNEEYALARVERKVAPGYSGFDFDTSPTVSLKDDLQRRDLTINAIAQDITDKKIIDPYEGLADLKNKLLRHVSPAFAEDPVRILRVGRFAARFAQYGFKVAPETIELMKQMVAKGEVNALVAERVWKELERALGEKTPEEFFNVLDACGALLILFPDLKRGHIELLKYAETTDPQIRFSILFFDCPLDKILFLCERYRVPSSYRELTVLVAEYYKDYQQIEALTPEQFLNLIQKIDALRRPERFKNFLHACALINKNFFQLQFLWLKYYTEIKKVDIRPALDHAQGAAIAEAIYSIRLNALKKSW